jgi:hypothetical protein
MIVVVCLTVYVFHNKVIGGGGAVWFWLLCLPVNLTLREAQTELHNSSRIWGSHGGEYEGGCLLGCSAV